MSPWLKPASTHADSIQYRPYTDPKRIQHNDQKKRAFGDKRAYVDGIPHGFLGVIEFGPRSGVCCAISFLEQFLRQPYGLQQPQSATDDVGGPPEIFEGIFLAHEAPSTSDWLSPVSDALRLGLDYEESVEPQDLQVCTTVNSEPLDMFESVAIVRLYHSLTLSITGVLIRIKSA